MEYKQQIAIKNHNTNRYLSIDPKTSKPFAGAAHPFYKHPEAQHTNETFQILNAANTEYTGPIIMQSAILVYAVHSQSFLCCLQNGDMKFEKLSPNEASLSKATKFMIYGSANTQTKRPIQEQDDIVFKFNDTNYMIAEIPMTCSWNGANVSPATTWKLQRAGIPPLPDWCSARPLISLSYLTVPDVLSQCLTRKDEKKALGQHPFAVQSVYLLEDLLFTMMSVEGTYIKKRGNSYEYGVETQMEQSTCDLSLNQLVSKILPLCNQHDQIEHYISQKSRFEFGYVSQALCSALRELTQKFLLMVNQLDHEFTQGELSLQKMWYYLQPSIRIIDALHRLVTNTQKLTGGALLSKLIDLINASTDSSVLEVYQYLLQKAFVPYMRQLAEWLYHGRVDDPFEEFLISEKRIQKTAIVNDYRDNYWDQRFTIRTAQIPKFLEKYAELILRTGKYINVIGDQHPPFIGYLLEHQGHVVSSQDFSHIIQCFEWANKEIINLLFSKENLIGRFKSVKTFFLFGSGDFFVHFMEAAESELLKDSKEISKEKLESLFDMAIRGMAINDPFKEDLFCYLDQYTAQEQIYALMNLRGGDIGENKPPRMQKLRGFDLFTLDIRVSWPANLILSRAALVNYQIIFRSLFNLHSIEKQLNETWLHMKSIKDSGLHHYFLKQNGLLQRMNHLIKTYLYYLSYDVIEKNFVLFQQKLENADNFEEVKTLHNKFTEDCLSESLITDVSFTKFFTRCLSSCQTFSKQSQQQISKILNFFRDPEIIDDQSRKMQMATQIRFLVSDSQFKSVQEGFIKQFDEAYRELLRLIRQYVSQQKGFVVNLLTKLDFQYDMS